MSDSKRIVKRIRGRRWQRIRERKFKENPLCVKCYKLGVIKVWTELDHIKPLEQGGTNDDDNLQGLCNEHHKEKTATEQGYKPRVKIGLDGYPVEQ